MSAVYQASCENPHLICTSCGRATSEYSLFRSVPSVPRDAAGAAGPPAAPELTCTHYAQKQHPSERPPHTLKRREASQKGPSHHATLPESTR